MRLFRRPDRLPAEVQARLPDGERVLSWADTPTGEVLVATPAGLWWPDPGALRLIGWQLISKVVWRENVLSVVQSDVVDDLLLVDRPTVRAELSVPRDLPPTVRKRVEANVVLSQVRSVPGGHARFVARRVPGQDGLTWWARLEASTSDSEKIRGEVRAQLALLRADWEAENLPD